MGRGELQMECKIRPYQPGEEPYVANLHQRLYTKEYAWGPSFTDYAAKIALDFAKKAKNDREELFSAEVNGRPAGCIMLCETDDPDVGQLRLYAVEAEYRKFGIGSALTKAFMEKAKDAGYRKLMLWTADPLTAAIHHYEKMGFHTVESVENTEWSTKGTPVMEVKMEMDL